MRIAAFDSGVGGLTAVAALLKKYSGLEVTYFGDLANLPYGTKSPDRIRNLTQRNIDWLLNQSQESQKDFDLLVIACNTASAHALDIAKKIGAAKKTPVIGVIEPGCLAALKDINSQKKSAQSKHNKARIVVLATSSTVQSNAYRDQLQQLNPDVAVIQKACPLFVPLVEDGLHKTPAAKWVADFYLKKIIKKTDTVILGCTHYPFLVPTLNKTFPKTRWIDAGAALLDNPEVKLVLQKAPSNPKKSNSLKIYFTDSSTSPERVQSFLKSLKIKKLDFNLEYIQAP